MNEVYRTRTAAAGLRCALAPDKNEVGWAARPALVRLAWQRH
ncbi:hypothetical protein D8I24_0421 [Cupriavidus necator H850]|nr:hypothetical protein D8I24_0421 [Cupriavidus necator H850]